LGDKVRLHLLEIGGDGIDQRGYGRVQRASEGDAERELAAVAQIELTGERNVAVRRRVEFPIHREIIFKIGPAVACGNITGRALKEGNGRADSHPEAILVRNQDSACFEISYFRVVVPAADAHVWRGQNIELQLVFETRAGNELGAHQNTVLVRIANDCFLQRVAAIAVAALHVEAQCCFRYALGRRAHAAALIVEERLTIANQKLNVANLRRIDGWIINFGE